MLGVGLEPTILTEGNFKFPVYTIPPPERNIHGTLNHGKNRVDRMDSLFLLICCKLLVVSHFQRWSGGIGIRASLRNWYRKVWEFESPLQHKL